MNLPGPFSWNELKDSCLNRRKLIRGAAGAVLGAGVLRANSIPAGDEDGDAACVGPNPIPGASPGLSLSGSSFTTIRSIPPRRWPISTILPRLQTSMDSWG